MPRPVFAQRSRIVDLTGGLPVQLVGPDLQRVAIGFSSTESSNIDVQIGFSQQLDTEGYFFAPTSGIEWITYQSHGSIVQGEFWGLHDKAPNPTVTVFELYWTQG